MMETRAIGKKKYTGVVRSDDGTPLRTGCIRLDDVIESGVEDKTTLADTFTACDEHEVENDARAAASRRPSMANVENTVKDYISMSVITISIIFIGPSRGLGKFGKGIHVPISSDLFHEGLRNLSISPEA